MVQNAGARLQVRPVDLAPRGIPEPPRGRERRADTVLRTAAEANVSSALGPESTPADHPWRSRVEAGRHKRDAAVPDGDEQPHCPAGWCRAGEGASWMPPLREAEPGPHGSVARLAKADRGGVVARWFGPLTICWYTCPVHGMTLCVLSRHRVRVCDPPVVDPSDCNPGTWEGARRLAWSMLATLWFAAISEPEDHEDHEDHDDREPRPARPRGTPRGGGRRGGEGQPRDRGEAPSPQRAPRLRQR